MSEPPAMIIDGRYRVLDRVGSGGMADVYSAEDLQLGRTVAVKVLHRRFAEDPGFVERFRLEASSAAGLSHPNVVAIYDRGAWDGTFYIAMEYLHGRTLKQIIEQEGPLATTRAVELAEQILKAARFAHSRTIIHRDLKPHNVIVDDDGRAKVTDFGIAKAGTSEMTETGSIMGTAQYLSPEQAEGLPVEASSDLYSIGVILYEMLTGRVPFDGDSAVAIALKHMQEPPQPPSELNPAVTPALEGVVLTALAKDPAHRFQSADEFLDALDAAMQPQALPLAPPEPVSRVHEPVADDADEPEGGRRRWWPWLAAALVVAAAIVGYVLLSGGEQVRVPNVVGQRQADAQAALRKAGFRSDVEARNSMTRPIGEVISQDPTGGSGADKGSTVTLRVSAGPGTITMPDLADKSRNDAKKLLAKDHMNVTERGQASSKVGENRVIETQPAAGTRVERGSDVTIVYSTGPPRVTVPKLVGSPIDDARDALRGVGLNAVVEQRETDSATPGTVLEQDPPADTRVRKGSDVRLVVAKQPAEVDVPDVTGSTTDRARQRLEAAGFSVSVEETDVTDPAQDGVVIRQSPSSGSHRRGSTVTITVGRLTEDTVTTTTDTTPTPPTTPDTTQGEQP